MERKMDNWTFARLCGGGAIAGVAICGMIFSALGIDAPNVKDIVGTVTGVILVVFLKYRGILR